jgi:hypothetical protein
VGTDREGILDASAGAGEIPLSALFDVEGCATSIEWTTGLGLAIRADRSADGAIEGTLGFGVAQSPSTSQLCDSVVRGLVFPDVDLATTHNGEQVYWPRHDGDYDHMSLGLGFRAEAIDR